MQKVIAKVDCADGTYLLPDTDSIELKMPDGEIITITQEQKGIKIDVPKNYFLTPIINGTWIVEPARLCIACGGSGHYDSDGAPPCGACDGTGYEREK